MAFAFKASPETGTWDIAIKRATGSGASAAKSFGNASGFDCQKAVANWSDALGSRWHFVCQIRQTLAERGSLVRLFGAGRARSGRRTQASACYPFATRLDFGVAAYANNHDGIGITLHLRALVFVNPKSGHSAHSLTHDVSGLLGGADIQALIGYGRAGPGRCSACGASP